MCVFEQNIAEMCGVEEVEDNDPHSSARGMLYTLNSYLTCNLVNQLLTVIQELSATNTGTCICVYAWYMFI